MWIFIKSDNYPSNCLKNKLCEKSIFRRQYSPLSIKKLRLNIKQKTWVQQGHWILSKSRCIHFTFWHYNSIRYLGIILMYTVISQFTHQIFSFKILLGAFEKLRKATISFAMPVLSSVRLCFRMDQLGSHWTDFDDILCLKLFQKFVEKIQVSLKSDKNKWYFTRCFHIYDNISLNSS
jgi:hypothetical protein